jgi:hypothetical protein
MKRNPSRAAPDDVVREKPGQIYFPRSGFTHLFGQIGAVWVYNLAEGKLRRCFGVKLIE